MAAPQANAASTFKDALRNFKQTAGLTQSELQDFAQTTLDDLKLSIADIQNKQRASRKLRYLKRLEPFLATMERYGKIIEVFLNISDIIAFVWGPMKFLLMVTKECADVFNTLLDAYQRISENIPQLEQYQALFESNIHVQRALGFIYDDILTFHKEALRYFRKSAWKQLFDAARKSFNDSLKHLESDLSRHTSLIDRQASIAEYQQSQNWRIESQGKFEEARLAELQRRRQSVQQWLGPSTAQTRHEHSQATEHRLSSSGQWLFSDDRFKKWYDCDYCSEPTLWLNGIPGAGKTVLASIIIEACRTLPDAKVCFFYCRSADEEHHAFTRVARAMLSQLMIGNDLLMQYIYDFITTSGESTLSSHDAARTLLDTAFRSCDKNQKIYIVIDGLDECNREDRKVITTWFKAQVCSVPTRDLGAIRCLFISQDDGFARKDLSNCFAIKLTLENTRQDIKVFCDRMEELIVSKFHNYDLKSYNISNVVAARAQGMFLYAKLVTQNLYEQASLSDLLDELRPDTFPNGLNEAYERVVKRIIGPSVQSRRRGQYAKRVLGWLVCTRRVLKWREIQGASSVDLLDGRMDRTRQLQEDCKDLLASLVERAPDDSVDLVHSTARRYLIEKAHICVPTVEFDMAHLCLAYLTFDHFVPELDSHDIRTALHMGDYAFADYASCFWATHLVEGVREVATSLSCNLDELVEVVDGFLSTHWASRPDLLTVSKTLQSSLAPLAHYDTYDRICQAIVSTKNQLLPTGKGPLDNEVLHLSSVVKKVRLELESFASAPGLASTQRDSIQLFYGPNLFKCARLNCRFYHEGFATGTQRDHHVAKHERPFPCVEEGCPWTTIGFVTLKEFKIHMKELHGIRDAPEPEYPEEVPEIDARHQYQKHPAIFQCALCPKRFTRPYNLRSHLRTHTNEKPFECSVCGASFARQHDRRRHEGLHSGEKNFICRGNLKDGNHWGCGRRYARADELGKHFRSEVGRGCIKPLLQEEMAEQSAHSMKASQASNPSNLLPAELLAQFPQLADPGSN